ncbi:unnamed protein product [Prorocentrum cordatum]|uniref:Uncharacterized protein n=1 Tax=Prorocentrum cordatum TaxID=2364126 RepID=A0ABN9UE45_9DINO|nr:unnamed protein product [Polarella glacialis]
MNLHTNSLLTSHTTTLNAKVDEAHFKTEQDEASIRNVVERLRPPGAQGNNIENGRVGDGAGSAGGDAGAPMSAGGSAVSDASAPSLFRAMHVASTRAPQTVAAAGYGQHSVRPPGLHGDGGPPGQGNALGDLSFTLTPVPKNREAWRDAEAPDWNRPSGPARVAKGDTGYLTTLREGMGYSPPLGFVDGTASVPYDAEGRMQMGSFQNHLDSFQQRCGTASADSTYFNGVTSSQTLGTASRQLASPHASQQGFRKDMSSPGLAAAAEASEADFEARLQDDDPPLQTLQRPKPAVPEAEERLGAGPEARGRIEPMEVWGRIGTPVAGAKGALEGARLVALRGSRFVSGAESVALSRSARRGKREVGDEKKAVDQEEQDDDQRELE